MTIDVDRERAERAAEAKGYAMGSVAAASYERGLKDTRRMLAAVLISTGPVTVDERTLLVADLAGITEAPDPMLHARRLWATMPGPAAPSPAEDAPCGEGTVGYFDGPEEAPHPVGSACEACGGHGERRIADPDGLKVLGVCRRCCGSGRSTTGEGTP